MLVDTRRHKEGVNCSYLLIMNVFRLGGDKIRKYSSFKKNIDYKIITKGQVAHGIKNLSKGKKR